MESKHPLIFGVLFLGCLLSANGQLIDNNLDVSFGYQVGFMLGDENFKKEGFEFPSFYNNLNNIQGGIIQGNYKVHKQLSSGLSFEQLMGSNWSSSNAVVFEESQINIRLFSIILRYHSGFKKAGIFNRTKLYTELRSGLGTSSISLENSPFEIYSESDQQQASTEGVSNIFQIKLCVGAEYSLSQNVGTSFAYSISKNLTQSPLNSDDGFLMSNITVGLFYKFCKDKRFFY